MVEVVADHDHVEEFRLRVDAERKRGIGGTRQHVGLSGHADDVRRVTAARAFGVDDAAFHGGDGVFHVTGFVERVGVDGNLHVHLVGHGKRGADDGGHGAPVLMDLEAAGAGLYLLAQGLFVVGVALAENAEIHGQSFGRLHDAVNVPRAGRDGGAVGAVGRSDAAAEEGGYAVGYGGLRLLGAYQMHVRVDAARGENEMLAGNGVRGVAHHEMRIHVVHHGGIARLAYARDASVADAHVGLDDTQDGVDDGGVGDDEIEHAVVPHGTGIAAGAERFAAAVDDLVAVAAQILFNFHIEFRIAEPDAVAYGGTVQAGVFLS